MTEETRLTKTELLTRIAAAWAELNSSISGLDDLALKRIKTAGGWTIKDTLAHLAMWERGIVYLLSRRPRPEGMYITIDQWKSLTLDEINDVIHRQWQYRPAAESRDALQAAHDEMLAALAGLDDDQLYLDYSHYDPTAAPAGRPVIDWVIGNTYGHFKEHAGYIRDALAKQAG